MNPYQVLKNGLASLWYLPLFFLSLHNGFIALHSTALLSWGQMNFEPCYFEIDWICLKLGVAFNSLSVSYDIPTSLSSSRVENTLATACIRAGKVEMFLEVFTREFQVTSLDLRRLLNRWSWFPQKHILPLHTSRMRKSCMPFFFGS